METDTMLIFIMSYYHSNLLYEIFTDDEKGNDYQAFDRMKELCKEFKQKKYDNEDFDIEDTTERFLLNKIKEELKWNIDIVMEMEK